MKYIKLTKHDKYVMALAEQIKYRYDSISTNVVIKNRKRKQAEIDILAKKGNVYDIYEVKCSHRISKAKRQAKKIKKYCKFKLDKSYFYCGSSNILKLLN